MTIATNISKTLIEITGEPRIEIAILELLKDAIEHRIEKINAEIKNLEGKYLISFEEFKNKFNSGIIPDSYSYSVEGIKKAYPTIIGEDSRACLS